MWYPRKSFNQISYNIRYEMQFVNVVIVAALIAIAKGFVRIIEQHIAANLQIRLWDGYETLTVGFYKYSVNHCLLDSTEYRDHHSPPSLHSQHLRSTN